MPAFALILGKVINNLGLYTTDPDILTQKVNETVPYFVYLGIAALIGAYCQAFFWTTSSVRQVNRIRGIYLQRVLHQEIGYFDTVGTSGYLLQGLNEDCITIQAAIGDKVAMFLFFFSTFVSGSIIALVRGWDMALVVLSLLPVLGGAGFGIMYLVARLTSVMNRAYADANSQAQQALSNIRTVYAFNAEDRTGDEYDGALDLPTKVGIRQGFIGGAAMGVVNLIAFCTYALAMWYGAKRVVDGAYDGGQVLTVLFSILIGGFALGQAAPNVQYFQQGQVAGARIFDILRRESEIDADAPGQELKQVEGVVELRDVTFAYPARPDKPVFEGFNLVVPAGAKIALVGESGSGKSTVVQLIQRFYDPQGGQVFLDGVDVRSLQLRWMRSQMGLVSQEPTLFATTIKENILFGRPGASLEDVIGAAKAANAHAFISALPKGYDTHVGEKGVQMSGGQKQRIAIARAILKDPRVLLLDEATSALDAESERIVQDALDSLMVGRTTVIVAHRLSTVRDADSIAVVYRGRVVEQGSHNKLLGINGAYATLVHMQQSADSQPSQQNSPRAARRARSHLSLSSGMVTPTTIPEDVSVHYAAATAALVAKELTSASVGSNVDGGSTAPAADSKASKALEVVVDGVTRRGSGSQGKTLPTGVGGGLVAPQRMASGWRRFLSLKLKDDEYERDALPEGGTSGSGNAGVITSSATMKKTASGMWRRQHATRTFVKRSAEEKAQKKKQAKGDIEEDDGPPVNVGMKRLAKLNGPELPAIVGGVAGAAGLGVLFPIFAIAFSGIISVFYEPVDQIQSAAQKWCLVFMGLGFFALVAAFLQSFAFNYMGQRLGRRVRVMMMRALLRQEVGWFDDERNSSGVLTSKLSADALAVKGQFGDTMGLLTQNIVTIIFAFIAAGVYSWRMMLVATSCLPLMVFAGIVQNNVMLKVHSEEDEKFAMANATASEAFLASRTVASFGMEDQVAGLYARALEGPTRDARKKANYAGIGFGFAQFCTYSIYSLGFWYMGLVVARRESSFQDALSSFMLIFMAALGIAQAQIYFPDVTKGKAAIQRVFTIIDRRPAIDASDPNGLRPTTVAGELELREVTFAYPQRPDAPVFEGFNLVVPAGQRVALVGESGSGKSTVIQLIERFYDPLSGQVLFDGVDIRELNTHWLRSQVGLVSQEPTLFNMTVSDNIRYGRPEASLEDVVAAAKAANAHTFITALPEGYDTKLGEGSIQLSGGQKQRIAIARAVVKDPRVLLLDEATSALDAESERIVQEALDSLMVGRTTVIVAHRLSTVRDADSIAVVFKGKLVEQGTHEELLVLNGSYARLVSHQMGN